MNFEPRQLTLNNVISYQTKIEKVDDLADQMFEAGKSLKDGLVQNDLYADGPVIYKYNPLKDDGVLELMTTVGNKLNFVGDNQSEYKFYVSIDLSTDYYYRHYNQNEKINYEEIKKIVEADHKEIVNIYHIILDLYGDIIVDIFCEVK